MMDQVSERWLQATAAPTASPTRFLNATITFPTNSPTYPRNTSPPVGYNDDVSMIRFSFYLAFTFGVLSCLLYLNRCVCFNDGFGLEGETASTSQLLP
jgi:hypothetical protein